MPDDRFTLVKMNITSQEGGIMITKLMILLQNEF